MKTGKTLVELAQEIARQQESKKDFVAPAPALKLVSNGKSDMDLGNGIVMPVGNIAHEQIAEKMGIPKKYYDRMRDEAPALLDSNVNHWLRTPQKDEKGNVRPFEKYMIRTLDGKVRALLSDKYRPLDNADCAEAILPVLLELDLLIMSCEITERHLFIKAVDRRIERDIPNGAKMGNGHTIFDTLSPAITIRNSEVGFAAFSVMCGVWTKQCTNLATFAERSVRKYHVGARQAGDSASYELLSEQTRRLTDAATWAQSRDVVKAAFDRARFDALVEESILPATQDKIPNVEKVIEVAAKKFSFTEGERGSVLQHLIEGGDLTRYGLSAAITRAAEDLPDYDRASDFEKLGGQVIELNRNQWKEIAQAA